MISFKQFITEMGGWSKTITQGSELTPAIAKKAIAVMPHFEKDFNKYLESNNVPPIKIGKAIGSSAYHERDIKNSPDKIYGDIDIIFSIPRISDMTESSNQNKYRKLVVDFINEVKPPYLFDDGEQNGQNIIVAVDDDWVQIDLVSAFNDTEDWTTHRMTPEHNLKGAFLGFLYASLADVLKLSIGSSGVQVKHIGKEIVPFKKLKVDKVEVISTDIGKFGLEVFNYFSNRAEINNPKLSPLLKASSGMNRTNIKFADLVKCVHGIGKSFELNNMFGSGDLGHIKDYDDFIQQIKNSYLEKANKSAAATKFDKAETTSAIKRASDTKDLLKTKPLELLKLL